MVIYNKVFTIVNKKIICHIIKFFLKGFSRGSSYMSLLFGLILK